MKKYIELWYEIKNLTEWNSIKKKIDKAGECGKDFMKIKFNSDDNLLLNKKLKLYNLIMIVKSIFPEDNKYYFQVFLDECLYEL